MVIWIIGLSGAGKTTLGTYLCEKLRLQGNSVVMLDGDDIRNLFSNDLSHSLQDREKNADRIFRLGQFIASQGITVVCPILSIFEKHRRWNRESKNKYYEVYIDTPMDILENRDDKKLYERFNKGIISEVAGKDLKFPIPSKPDLKILNNKSKKVLLSYAELIIKSI